MDNIFIYYVEFPNNVKEMITPCYDGYTIYINRKLPREARNKAYQHALTHIRNNDFNGANISAIEIRAHDIN
jgi:hypothetical protein